jgi:hypothetical protein
MESTTDENGNKIYTFSKAFFVKCAWRPDTVKDKYKYTMALESSYGFLRVICDDKGKMLAYARVMPIVPDPFPSQFYTGIWYAFETYNRELIKDFNIKVYNRSNLDDIVHSLGGSPRLDTAIWQYDSEKNSYNLRIFTGIGSIDRCFLVTDKNITTGYGVHGTRTYKFNTVAEKPQPHVVAYINNQLEKAGIKPKDNKLFPKIRNPFQKISVSFRDIFQKGRGAQ